jgi:hypothetical protein
MIIGSGLIQAKVPGESWWLAGGISSGNCIGAWQAVGAASQSASYVNLHNPGTYDLTQGADYPTWSAANGWHVASYDHSGDYDKHLDTGIVVPSGAPTYTGIARFQSDTALAGHYVFGSGDSIYAGQNEFGIAVYSWGNGVFVHGATAQHDPGVDYAGDADGTVAIAGTTPYRNGSALGGSTSGNVSSGSRTVILWNTRINDGSVARALGGKLFAVAIYSTTLTGGQISALHTAMMAL